MKKVNFFTDLFNSSKRIIKNIQPELQSLEEEIKKIDAMDNKIEAIVRLFQIISPIQDAGGFSQEISILEKRKKVKSSQIKALKALQKYFCTSGRAIFGMNRTAVGEKVTAEKVFLGNVFGIFTKSAAYWLSKKSELEKTLRYDISKNPVSNWYLINDYQCGEFVKNHTNGILEQIAVLKAVD